MFGLVSFPRVVAVVALAALIPVGSVIPALAPAVAAALIVVGVTAWDTLTHPTAARSPQWRTA